MPGTVLIES